MKTRITSLMKPILTTTWNGGVSVLVGLALSG